MAWLEIGDEQEILIVIKKLASFNHAALLHSLLANIPTPQSRGVGHYVGRGAVGGCHGLSWFNEHGDFMMLCVVFCV